jgi:hypothetical protein
MNCAGERRSCARQLSYKRQRADLRPSLFWNAYDRQRQRREAGR